MDFPEGGKIDTVVYSAATGALSSTARAGNGAASVVRPTMEIITRRNMRIVPTPPDCCCLPANRYLVHQPRSKNPAKIIAAVLRCQDRSGDRTQKPGPGHGTPGVGKSRCIGPPTSVKMRLRNHPSRQSDSITRNKINKSHGSDATMEN